MSPDGLTYAPLAFGFNQGVADWLDIKLDTAAAPGPSPPDIAQAATFIVPNSGSYTLRAFVLERSAGVEYELNAYRAALDDIASSTLVGTVGRSSATATTSGAASVLDDVVLFEFPLTSYIAEDTVTIRFNVSVGTPSANFGGLILLGGASDV